MEGARREPLVDQRDLLLVQIYFERASLLYVHTGRGTDCMSEAGPGGGRKIYLRRDDK
jgi:hypothetical protein